MGNDSDDSDSDYAPEPEKEEAEVQKPQASSGALEGALTGKRRARVDQLWEELGQSEASELRRVREKRAATAEGEGSGSGARKRQRKAAQVLSSIFGGSTARDIMAKVGDGSGGGGGGGKGKVSAAAEAAAAAVLGLPQKKQVTEVKKFAGREIKVTRAVVEGSAEDRAAKEAAAAAAKPKTNLDAVLSGLEEAKSISTVTKSSFDWDTYKEKEGLHDELAAVTKDGAGYLHKQDFLTRVDQRRFEQERDQRMSRKK